MSKGAKRFLYRLESPKKLEINLPKITITEDIRRIKMPWIVTPFNATSLFLYSFKEIELDIACLTPLFNNKYSRLITVIIVPTMPYTSESILLPKKKWTA